MRSRLTGADFWLPAQQLKTEVNSTTKKKLRGIDKEGVTNLLWVQPTCSALLLIPQKQFYLKGEQAGFLMA